MAASFAALRDSDESASHETPMKHDHSTQALRLAGDDISEAMRVTKTSENNSANDSENNSAAPQQIPPA